jgi:Putative metal-binding motif
MRLLFLYAAIRRALRGPMRPFVLVSITLLSSLSFAVAGCGGDVNSSANSSNPSSGSAGQGAAAGDSGAAGSAATAGSGGSPCMPEGEVCDGQDNNCDGKVDEGCACTQGETQGCYSGPPGTQDVGACKGGTQTCDAAGAWGPCADETVPADEACNGADDDCDGAADDMGTSSCGVGACLVTVTVCKNGVMSTCAPGMPDLEVCDGLDNNCNQLTDESFPDKGKICDTGQLGPCKNGILQCLTVGDVTAAKCVTDVQPVMEQCDDVDNDCDGVVDNNVPGTGGTCSTGLLGPCANGTISCKGGIIDCFSDAIVSAEVCGDAVDNDCNGVVDDAPGVNMPCDTGLLGACKDGINMCQNGAVKCVQTVQAAPELCDNKDNDCDGVVDPGCLYTFTGVATNLPIAQLTGWTQCYMDSYATSGVQLSTILGQCSKAKLLMGCRPTGSNVLQVAAHAPRQDVIFDTGTGNVLHDANGVGWYYNAAWSWGFAPSGDAVNRNSCDVIASSIGGAGPDPDKRLCWHTFNNAVDTGWRCGTNDSLNFSSAFERIVFHAD